MKKSIYNFPFIFITIAVFALFSSPKAGFADTVYLNDGSQISGQIIRLDQTAMTVKTAFAGDIDIQAAAITGIQSHRRMVTDIKGGDRIVGTLLYDKTAGQMIHSRLLGSVAVNTQDIQGLWGVDQKSPAQRVLEDSRRNNEVALKKAEEQHAEEIKTLKDKEENRAEDVWSGSVRFGLSGSKGNTDEQNFDGKVSAKRETEFDRLNLSLQARIENDDGRETENEIIAKADIERDLTERLFAFSSLVLERDKSEEIDLRSNLTGGLGYFVIKQDHHEWKPRLGVGYEVTSFENSPTEEELVLSAGYDYRLDMFEQLRFMHGLTYYPTLDDPGGNYRLDSDASLAYPLDDENRWSLELGLQNQYDSMPSNNVEELDTYYSVGLARKFK